ncbi:hypothetical protein GCM10009665_11720 [Kitasatospora nipponensis]|uniref:Histidine kinase/HSP90-like ATPase domain-containing protein n=1 Tax=Kitasatospora nipponensis TaxID=258049 RepID=A0ABN1VTW4_9ACTN
MPSTARAPRAARQLLGGLLERVDGGGRFAEDGALVVTELVSNAVRHGQPGGARRLVFVRFDLAVDRLTVEVHDASPLPPCEVTPDAMAQAGRGLLLVRALTTSWGWGPREGVGKAVWAVLAPAGGPPRSRSARRAAPGQVGD